MINEQSSPKALTFKQQKADISERKEEEEEEEEEEEAEKPYKWLMRCFGEKRERVFKNEQRKREDVSAYVRLCLVFLPSYAKQNLRTERHWKRKPPLEKEGEEG